MRVFGVDPVWFGREVYKQVKRDDVTGLAAELAYHFFFALFPFLIFLASLSGFVAGMLRVPNPVGVIVDLLGRALPPGAEQLIRPQIEYLVTEQTPGLLSLGILGAIYAATNGTKAIMKAMNRAYGVEETRPFWKKNLVALGLTLLASALIIVSFILFFVGQIYGRSIAASLGAAGLFDWLTSVVFWVIPFLLLMGATAYVYWAAPNVQLPLKWTTPGALVFAVGWLVATFAFSIYVSSFGSYNATYGALGGIAILLLWFYITSLVMVIGAEVNSVVDKMTNPEEVRAQQERSREEKARQEREEPKAA